MKALYFEAGKHYLNLKKFEEIQMILDKFPLEDITIGDAGEINIAKLGDLSKIIPLVIQRWLITNIPEKVLEIIFSEECKTLLKEIPEFRNHELC